MSTPNRSTALGVTAGMLLASASALNAQTLVRDLRSPSSSIQSSSPDSFVDSGAGFAVFSANSDYGIELWHTDGTTSGTYLLQDIAPGPDGSRPEDITVIRPGLVFFTADVPGLGREPFITDGTVPGTLLLGDLRAGRLSSNVESLCAFGGRLVFVAEDGLTGRELWTTDGTPTGTRLLTDLIPGPGSSRPQDLTIYGGRIWFSASGQGTGRELWSTDGSSGGARLELDLIAGATGSSPVSLAALGNGLLFFAGNLSGGAGQEPAVTDGTLAGTRLLRDIRSGSSSSNASKPVVAGPGRAFFLANDGVNGRELWFTDGSPQGTRLLEVAVGATSSRVEHLTAFGADAVFRATSPSAGNELWRSDGQSISLIRDLAGGSNSSLPGAPVVIGNTIYFAATTPSFGTELYMSDGTPAGTQLVIDLEPGTAGSNLRELSRFGNRLLFAAQPQASGAGSEPYISDGTAAGTRLVADVSVPAGDSQPLGLVEIDAQGRIAFVAQTPSRELFVSDGTPNGTVALPTGAAPGLPVRFRGELWFPASGSTTGTELWRSDGSAGGTMLAVDIQPGRNNSSPRELTPMSNGRMIFIASSPGAGFEVMVTDGTAAGTQVLVDANPGIATSNPLSLTAVGPRAFFVASTPATGRELWVTDGTPGGTRMVREIRPGTTSSQLLELTAVGNLLFFRSFEPATGSELWVSDGTAAGTRPFDVVPGTGSSSPRGLATDGTRLFYTAQTPTTGIELFVADASSARLLIDLTPGTRGTTFDDYVPLISGGRGGVAFVRTTEAEGRELWWTDGSGSQLLVDAAPGPRSGVVEASLAVVSANEVAFAATSGSGGLQLWTSDGTQQGTSSETSFRFGRSPGAVGFGGSFLRNANDELYFVADGPSIGQELWVIGNGAVNAFAQNYGAGCDGSGRVKPRIRAVGLPRLGDPNFAIDLIDGALGAPAVVNFGFSAANQAIGGGCSIRVGAPLLPLGSLRLNGIGRGRMPLPIVADPSLRGARLFLQGFVLDAGGAILGVASATEGLELILGD